MEDAQELEPRAPSCCQSRVDERRPQPSLRCHLAQTRRVQTSLSRIKECQLDLYADRTSAATMRANQLRLWFASMAYVLLCALRRIGLEQTHFANATCGSIRLKLLKIGALVQFSVRRIKVGMASACPAADVWGQAARRLAAAASARCSPA